MHFIIFPKPVYRKNTTFNYYTHTLIKKLPPPTPQTTPTWRSNTSRAWPASRFWNPGSKKIWQVFRPTRYNTPKFNKIIRWILGIDCGMIHPVLIHFHSPTDLPHPNRKWESRILNIIDRLSSCKPRHSIKIQELPGWAVPGFFQLTVSIPHSTGRSDRECGRYRSYPAPG